MATRQDIIKNRITADEKDAIRGLKRFSRRARRTGREASGAAKKMRTSFLKLGSALAGLALAYVGISILIRTFTRLVGQAITAAGLQEKAELGVALALKRIGLESQTALDSVLGMASAFQDMTGQGDEAILMGQRLLITMGKLSGEGLKEATQAALDMGAVTGNLEQAFDLVAKASVGYTGTLGRYGIIVDAAGTDTEKFAAAIEKIGELFGGEAAAQLNTFSGRVLALKNRWADFLENLGLTITASPVVQKLLEELEKVIKDLTAAISSEGGAAGVKAFTIGIVDFGIVLGKVLPVMVNFVNVGRMLNANFFESKFAPGADTVGSIADEMVKVVNSANIAVERLERIRELLLGTSATGGDAGGGGDEGLTPPEEGADPLAKFGLGSILDAQERATELLEVYGALNKRTAEGVVTGQQYAAAMALIAAEHANLVALGIEEVIPFIELWGDKVDEVTHKMRIMGRVTEQLARGFANVAASMIASALAGTKSNASFKAVLEQLGQSAIAQALYHTALGLAALTPWGAGLYGPAHLQFQAAGIFAAAGVGLSVAARFAGGGGGGAGAGIETPDLPDIVDPLTGAGPQITIIIEGQGIFSTPEELAQIIAVQLQRQLSRGGN